MTIKTKLDINDKCFFLMLDAIREAIIEQIETRNKEGESTVIYTIDENPAGSQYTKRLFEHEVFKTKQELLDSL